MDAGVEESSGSISCPLVVDVLFVDVEVVLGVVAAAMGRSRRVC